MGNMAGGPENHHIFSMPCSFLNQTLIRFSRLRDEIFNRVNNSLSSVTCAASMGRLTCHQPLEVQAPSSVSLSIFTSAGIFTQPCSLFLNFLSFFLTFLLSSLLALVVLATAIFYFPSIAPLFLSRPPCTEYTAQLSCLFLIRLASSVISSQHQQGLLPGS